MADRWIVLRFLALVVIAAAIIAAVTVYLLQDRLIYHPQRYKQGQEAEFGRPIVRLNYQTGEGAQAAFYVPPLNGEPPSRIWIMFSGNATDALGYKRWLGIIDLPGTGFLLMDYPGYGYNEGKPSPDAIAQSARTATQTLSDHLAIPPADLYSRMGSFGASLGAAAATAFAADHPEIHRLVIACPFTSLGDMARGIVGWPLSLVAHRSFDNRANLAELMARHPKPSVAIFHGDKDDTIPVEMSRTLSRIDPSIAYTEVPGAGHGNVIYKAAPEIDWAMREMP